jgi:DNA-binding CsgD family transcriptional regulator
MWLVSAGKVAGNLPVRLEPGEFIVGRAKRAQIVIADATVSRRHARIVRSRDSLTVEDLASANGTFVSACPVINRCEIRVGDQIRFGAVLCAISASPFFLHDPSDDESTHQIPKRQTECLKALTKAQYQIVTLVVAGRSEAQIAELLCKSPHTVHTHLKAIFARLNVHSRAELIRKVLAER